MGAIRVASELSKSKPSVPRTTGRFAGEYRTMRVIYTDRDRSEIRYSMTSMADALVEIHDPESTAIGYELEGWDY